MKKLLITIGFLLLPLTSQAAIALVQSAKWQSGVTSNSIPFTISAPVAGNVLVACTSYSQYQETRVLTAPDGTWTKINTVTIGNDSVDIWWHPVVGGDGTTYTFPISGGNEWQSGIIYEFSGVNTSSAADQSATSTMNATSMTTAATNTITPTVLNTQVLACMTHDQGGANGFGTNGVSSGWTQNQAAINTNGYHSTVGATKDALTTDTSTGISMSFTWNSINPSIVGTIITNLKPATAATVPTHSLFKVLYGRFFKVLVGRTFRIK